MHQKWAVDFQPLEGYQHLAAAFEITALALEDGLLGLQFAQRPLAEILTIR